MENHTQVIHFSYEMRNANGVALRSPKTENMSILTGNKEVFRSIEGALNHLKKNEGVDVLVKASEAFGIHGHNLVSKVTNYQLSKKLTLGSIQTLNLYGNTTLELRKEEKIKNFYTMDANHELAGKDIVFRIILTSKRPATPEETNSSGTIRKIQRNI